MSLELSEYLLKRGISQAVLDKLVEDEVCRSSLVNVNRNNRHKSTIDTLYVVKPLFHDQIFFDKFHMSV